MVVKVIAVLFILCVRSEWFCSVKTSWLCFKVLDSIGLWTGKSLTSSHDIADETVLSFKGVFFNIFSQLLQIASHISLIPHVNNLSNVHP